MQAIYKSYNPDTKTLEILMDENLADFIQYLTNNASSVRISSFSYDPLEFQSTISNLIGHLCSDNTHRGMNLDECQRVSFYVFNKFNYHCIKTWVAEAYLNGYVSIYLIPNDKRQINCRLDMEHYAKELGYWMTQPFDNKSKDQIEALLDLLQIPYILTEDILCIFPNTKDEAIYLICHVRGCVYLYATLQQLQQNFLDEQTNTFHPFVDPFKFPTFNPCNNKDHHLPCTDDAMEMYNVFETTILDTLTRKS